MSYPHKTLSQQPRTPKRHGEPEAEWIEGGQRFAYSEGYKCAGNYRPAKSDEITLFVDPVEPIDYIGFAMRLLEAAGLPKRQVVSLLQDNYSENSAFIYIGLTHESD